MCDTGVGREEERRRREGRRGREGGRENKSILAETKKFKSKFLQVQLCPEMEVVSLGSGLASLRLPSGLA